MTHLNRIVRSFISFAVLTAGCARSANRAPQGTPPPLTSPSVESPASNSPSLPEIDPTPYAGPAVVVDVLQRESFPPQCVAAIEITAPTGGWTLALDRAAVVGDTAKVFLTLERPGEGEMVTQSLVTLRKQYVSAEPCFAHAEVYVHLAQRGVSTLTTNYRLAAKK